MLLPLQKKGVVAQAAETVTVVEAHDAQRVFLQAIWRQHGRLAAVQEKCRKREM